MASQKDTAVAWAEDRKAYDRRSGSLKLYDRTLWSYGMHWPLAFWVEVGGRKIGIVNGDRGSYTTMRHLGGVRRVVEGRDDIITLSLGVIREAMGMTSLNGVRLMMQEGDIKVVGWTQDEDRSGNSLKEEIPEAPPGWTMWVGEPNERGDRQWRMHRPGSVLLEYAGKSYLLGVDEGSYFMVRLPEVVSSVESAYACLLPQDLPKAFHIRQGEYFFVEQPGMRVRRKDMLKMRNLNEWLQPEALTGANHHVATSVYVDDEGRVYARGLVRHRTPRGRLTGEHRTVRLTMKGKGTLRWSNRREDWPWWRVYINRAVESWSAGASGIGVD